MANEGNEKKGRSFRMDFVQEVVDYEEVEDGVKVLFALKPNPRRYEKVEEDDFEGYYDKLDDVYISMSALEDMAKQVEGNLIYSSFSEIRNITEWAEERKPKIEEFLTREDFQPELEDASEELLQKLKEENETRFVILCIDLVDSTRLSQEMGAERYRKYVQLFFREMSLLVKKFLGYVLDYQGDRIVAYFPEPDYIGMHDNAIDCATCMDYMIEEVLNPILTSNDYPEMQFRIGMDSGEADIAAIGADGVRGELSLFGETINLASKIEERADPNDILMGEETERNLHTMWRQNTELIDLEDWDYEQNGRGYRIYRYKT